jgi:hypothetical protein
MSSVELSASSVIFVQRGRRAAALDDAVDGGPHAVGELVGEHNIGRRAVVECCDASLDLRRGVRAASRRSGSASASSGAVDKSSGAMSPNTAFM